MMFSYFLKSIVSNKSLWGWGVLFMVFWLVLGAFVFANGSLLNSERAALAYTSSYYGEISLFSFSSLAITISYTIYYGSSSLAYGFRYTRLSPSKYFFSLMGASSVMASIMSVMMMIITYMMFSERLGYNLFPSDLPGTIAISALSGAFMMVLAILLVLLVVNYIGLRNIGFVGFVPLVLSYILGFGQLYANLPTWLEYASPFNAIVSLLFTAYDGSPIHTQIVNAASGTLSWPVLLLAIIVWVLILSIADIYLLGRIKPRAIEEARQV